MILRNGEDTRDLHHGKFDDGMAVYLYAMLLNGDTGDSAHGGDGLDYVERWGRRTLTIDGHGFVTASKFDDEATAEMYAMEQSGTLLYVCPDHLDDIDANGEFEFDGTRYALWSMDGRLSGADMWQTAGTQRRCDICDTHKMHESNYAVEVTW